MSDAEADDYSGLLRYLAPSARIRARKADTVAEPVEPVD
jgi:hypothetical protein